MPALLPIKPKNSQTWTNKLYVRQVKEEPDAACSKLTPLFSLRLILKISRYTHM